MRRPPWYVAGLGLVAMAVSLALPWVRVSVGADLAGAPADDRTYWLGALPGATALVLTDWLVLLAVFVLAWRRPRWCRVLVGVAAAVLAIFGLSVLNLGRDTVPADRYPVSHLLAGAWLGSLAAVEIVVALGILARSRAAEPSTVDLIPSTMDALAVTPVPTAEDPVGGPGPESGWSARPVWQPWYRRRGPVVTLVFGGLVLLMIVGGGVWLTVVAPADAHPHPGDLHGYLVAAPAGTEPISPAAVSEQLELTARDGVDMAGEGWTGPADGDRGAVALLRFDSEGTAYRVLSGFAQVEARRMSSRPVPEIPGALAYDLDNGLLVIGVQGDVIFEVAELGPDATTGDILLLATAQYGRL